ncbi:MAG: NAD(P)H-binding protein, partial [Caldilineaceae bacterium]|nr:NAD(P)H-binding protein [Caldilineaceae bacterium]
MNKVFVTGATGYIGSSVAQAFRNAGYEVWGLTRSEAKASQLAQQEIHPVLGSMQEPESYANAASQADVLVQAAVDYQNGTAELDSLTVNTLLSIAKPGTVLLYTSGVWV